MSKVGGHVRAIKGGHVISLKLLPKCELSLESPNQHFTARVAFIEEEP